MSPVGALVLAALLGEHGLTVVADLLNLRALDRGVPPELCAFYDGARYHRAQAYARAHTALGLVASTVGLAATLAFWFADGFDRLDGAVRGLALGPVGTGLVYIAILALARVALALPFAWWSTFVVEERFGFNRTSAWTFWTDRLKGALIGLAVGGPLLAAILWLFTSGLGQAWLACWAMSTAAMVVMQLVAPTWIMPLFSRFTPLAEGPLREAIVACAHAAGYPIDGVWVIDGSRRSTKANAFFTGFGRHKRIALFDTLVATLDPAAVVGVVAHEIGHYRCGHVAKGMVLGILHLGLVFLLFSVALRTPPLFAAFGVATPSVHVGLVVFGLLLTPLELGLSIALNAWSRRNEREADRFAVATTGTGEPLARGLKRLSADSLSTLTPHPLYVLLHYSHPPLLERLRALAASA